MKLMYRLELFIYLSLIQIVRSNELVQTNSGPIHGKTINTPTGKEVTVFWGIPYAEPPLDNLRFRPPINVKPWSEPLDATNKPKACIQFIGPNVSNAKPRPWWREPPKQSSEDCLYLNIWVPNPQPRKAAVLIWIHGGGYYAGFSLLDRYNGQIFASEENVIVVSLNYRLSVLGFLYLGHPEVPGNVGILDQKLAIKWVFDNVEFFGGDPKKITVIGQSAGGVSAGYQLSNMSRRGLVKRAIVLSGNPKLKWAKITKEEALESALKLAKESKCKSTNPEDIAKCLRDLRVQDLREATFRVSAFRQIVFPAVIDDKIVSASPDFQNANAVLFGETLNDGAHQLSRYAAKLMNQKLTQDELLEFTKNVIYNKDDGVAKLVKLFYTNWTYPEDLSEMRSSLLELATDTFMTCGNNEFGSLLKKQGVKSYRFIFNHVPSVSDWPKWFGSVHGDEIEFIFGGVLNPERGYAQNELTLSRKVMRLMANFAKTGNPNEVNDSDPKFPEMKWPTYSRNRKYLSLGLKERLGNNHRVKECSFWKDVIEVLESHEKKIESCSKSP